MKKKREGILLGRLFKKIAGRIGAKVHLEPHWGIAGRVTFKSGVRRYFRYNSVDLNTLGSSSVASDKDYANYFMKKLGYHTIPGEAFYSDAWCKAIGSKRNIHSTVRYAEKLGFPVIVKPNSGSQGTHVNLVHTKKDLLSALSRVFKDDRIALVQKFVAGEDYRIVVLDDRVISAYRRIPLCVVGDGKSSIKKLLEQAQRRFERNGRDTTIKSSDPRISNKLARSHMTLASVPASGKTVYLLDNANLSSGGESIDVTSILHPSVRSLAVTLTKDMGLRFCGVDLLINGSVDEPLGEYHILEINDSPGLDHYAASGKAQRKIVEDLYFQVLKAME